MVNDLTLSVRHNIKPQISTMNPTRRGARKKRRRRWPPMVSLLVLLLLLLCAQLLVTSSSASEQQQPSQLFLPATHRLGPISLVPRVNQKRLEEEVDGFIMQAQQNNATASASSGSGFSGRSRSIGTTTTTEQQPAVVTFETTTTGEPSSTGAAADSDLEYRIPIDANRQHFVTHDQLTNASGADIAEPFGAHQSAPDSAAAEQQQQQQQQQGQATANSEHRGQQQQWLRAVSKVSHVSSLLSDLFNYLTKPAEPTTGGDHSAADLFSAYINRTPVETSAPLPSPADNGDPANSAQVPDNLHQAQGKTPLDKQTAALSPVAPLPAEADHPAAPDAGQQAATQVPAAVGQQQPGAAADGLGADHQGRQYGAAAAADPGWGAPSAGGALYFLSSGNGSAAAAASAADGSPAYEADRRHMEEPASGSAATTTTTAAAPALAPKHQVAQPSADAKLHPQQQQQQQQTATKRVADQAPASADQSSMMADSSSADGGPEQPPQATCTGYCTIPLFTMLCDSTYRSEECGELQSCCVTTSTVDHTNPADQQQQQQRATTTSSPADNTDLLQQNQFIEQASRPQPAGSVCRGACLPMYHSSLCMKPNEIQLDSPVCLPNFVCCAAPPGADDSTSDQLEASPSGSGEQAAASGSNLMVSAPAPPEQPLAGVTVSADDGSLAAALVPLPPPPMLASGLASQPAEQTDHQQQQQQQQMLRQSFYSVRPTSKPLVQATTKSAGQTIPPASYASPATSFMSQLYQMFKSTTNSNSNSNSNNNNNSRDKQLQLPQTVAPSVQPVVAQASFLSHLFADPYQALYGSHPRPPPTSAPPNNLIQQQQQPIFNQNYGPLVAESQQQHLVAANNKNRLATFLVDNHSVHPLNRPTNSLQQQPQPQHSGGVKFKQQQQQMMMMMIPENSQPIVPKQQTPSDQEQQLLYMQHQMYLHQQQQQQFNKHNGFSFAPNQQQQQRFHYPVVADNAHPAATFVLANQKPLQQSPAQASATSPAAPVTKPNTSQMKVAQLHHPPHPLLGPAPTVGRKQQVTKPEQPISSHTPARPTGSGGRHQVNRIQQQQPPPPPLEQKGFVGLPNRQQQQQQQQQQQNSKPQTTASSATNNEPSSPLHAAPLFNVLNTSSVERTDNKIVSTCGVPRGARRSSGLARGRVMGGSEASPGHWCWQAALLNNKNEYLCGGALINAKWVLTAAHCITHHLKNDSDIFVRLGQHNLNSSGSAKGAKSIQVKASYVHHNHDGQTLNNDVALLRLEKAVDFDDEEESNICLVCVPDRSSQIEIGKRCVVTGYGYENEQGPAALRVRQTELPIVADQECQSKTSAGLNRTFLLPANSFCAGGEQGQDACHGDGGSPLSCLVNGQYELTGIVSWGYKCGQLPGLYSKVSAFVGWINQIVSVNN